MRTPKKKHVYETIKLGADEEYRIYLKHDEWIRVWMVNGTAEVFGTELREAQRNEKFNAIRPHSRHSKKSKRGGRHHKMSIDAINSSLHDHEEMYCLKDAYLFSNCNVSIYSFQGAQLYVKYETGKCEHKFKTPDTQYQIYCNYNASLTNMRRSAEVHQTERILDHSLAEQPSLPKLRARDGDNERKEALNEHKALDSLIMQHIATYGPRVLILGPSNSGKASLAKILSNYALRSQFHPLLVDLDCSINMVSIPGTIAAVTVSEPIDAETGFNHCHSAKLNSRSYRRGGTGDDKKAADGDEGEEEEDGITEQAQLVPMVYFYGDDRPDRRLKVYEKCVERLAVGVKKKLVVNLETRAAGLIVKAHSCLNNATDAMKSLLDRIVQLFHIDVVLVIDDELTLNFVRTKYRENNARNFILQQQPQQLQMDLSRYWQYRCVAVEKAVKSGGVMVREQADRLAIGRNLIRSYFYGAHNHYRPLSCETYPQFLRVYQIGSGQSTNDLLPSDSVGVTGSGGVGGAGGESFAVLPVRFDASLRGQILAVLHVDNGVIEKEQYQLERDLHTLTNHHDASAINMAQVLGTLIEVDGTNDCVTWNRNTSQQLSTDPFENDAKRKSKAIKTANVMGFVHVQDVRNYSKITLLNPCQNKLPLKCLLKGHINWHDR